MENVTKKCMKCGRELPVSSFNKCRSRKDGLQTYCKECSKEANKSSSIKKLELMKENPLSAYTPRQLMSELKARGFDGELIFVKRIKLSDID